MFWWNAEKDGGKREGGGGTNMPGAQPSFRCFSWTLLFNAARPVVCGGVSECGGVCLLCWKGVMECDGGCDGSG